MEKVKKMREKRDIDEGMTKIIDEILAQYLEDIIAKRPAEDFDDDEDDPKAKTKNVGVDALDQATSKKKEESKPK